MLNVFTPALTLLLTSLSCSLLAQEYVEVSHGAAYAQQTYYSLGDNATTSVAHTEWDIAFTAFGGADGGILINEATQSEGSPLYLYLAPTTDFSETIPEEDLDSLLYNSELSWEDGAFNIVRDVADPFDYGWGVYDFMSHTLNGTAVYAIQLRDGSFRKLEIQSLSGGVYTFRHAALDGTDEQIVTIDKAEFSDAGFAYFSFATGSTIESVPAAWDMVFTRYITPLDDGEGGVLDYLVTGVLTNNGIEVAQADGMEDPYDVNYADYQDLLSSDLDVIGYDWKSFDLSTFSWGLVYDRVFFVRNTETSEVWQVYFIDFEGSSTGNVVFEKTYLGVITNVDDPNSPFAEATIFPNPAPGDEVNVSYTLKESGSVYVSLTDALGRTLWQGQQDSPAGWNISSVPVTNLASGTYFLTLSANGMLMTRSLVIQ